MHRFLEELKDFPKKGDWVLLILCLVTSGFGLIVMASATSAEKFGSNTKYIIIQLLAIALGVLMFAIVSSIDADTISENRMLLTAFNIFILLLLIPFGTDNNTGNKSWLKFPGGHVVPSERYFQDPLGYAHGGAPGHSGGTEHGFVR